MLGEQRVSELEGQLVELLEERVSENDVGPFGNEASKAHMSSLVNDVILSLLESYDTAAVKVILNKVKRLKEREDFEEFLDYLVVQGSEDLRPHLFRLWMCLHDVSTKRTEIAKLHNYDERVTRPIFNQKLREIIDYVLVNCCPERGFLEVSEEADDAWRSAVQSSVVQQDVEVQLAAMEVHTRELFNNIKAVALEGVIDDEELYSTLISSIIETLSIEDVHEEILIHYSREVPGPRPRRTTLFQLVEATMPVVVQELFAGIERSQYQTYISTPNSLETEYIRNSFFDLYGSFIGWGLCRRNYEFVDAASQGVEPEDVRLNGDTLGFVLDKLYTTAPDEFQRLHLYIKAKGWKADLVDNIAAAIAANRFQFAKLLIEISNHLDRQLFDGNCLVHLAAMRGFIGVISKLHEHGANVGIKRSGDGKTAYHMALEVVQGLPAMDDIRVVQTIEVLRRCNADINAADALGATPLHTAIGQVGRINSALKLIALGVGVNALNQSGDTALTLLLGSRAFFSMRLFGALTRANAQHRVFVQADGVELNSVMIAILSRSNVLAKLEALTPAFLATPEAVNRHVDNAQGTYLHWLLDVTTPENVTSDLASLKFLSTRGLDLNRPNLLGYSALDQVVIDSKSPQFFVFLVENGVRFSDMARNSLKAQISGLKRFYSDALDDRLQEAISGNERANILAFKREIEVQHPARALKRSGADVAANDRQNNEIKRSR